MRHKNKCFGKHRLLAALFCISLFFADIASAGMTAQAAEADAQTEVAVQDTEPDTQAESALQEPAELVGEDEKAEENECSAPEDGEEGEKSEEPDLDEEPAESVSENMSDESVSQEEPDAEEILPESDTEEELTESISENALTVFDTAVPMAAGLIAEGRIGTIDWRIDGSGKLTIEGTGDYDQKNGASTPWKAHADKIKSAEIKLTGCTSTSAMFTACSYLTEVDLSGLDTSEVTDMSYMFAFCESLKKVDLSGFKTSKVTTMKAMFQESGLTSLDLRSFDTASVTDMSRMFWYCESMEAVDLSSFRTGRLTSTDQMFSKCISLKTLDMGSFDTSNVTSMYQMFYDCKALKTLNLDSFDIRKVESMSEMFMGCERLEQLDLSSFETTPFPILYLEDMFYGCKSLKELNLSGFDLSAGLLLIGRGERFFYNCDSLERIYSPINLKSNSTITLPGKETDTWYLLENGTSRETLILPQERDKSLLLTKNKRPAVVASHITAKKGKTAYYCGDVIELTDLSVTYYGNDGSVRKLKSSDYTTNKNEIDMTTPGEKTLTVTYTSEGGSALTAAVTLTVTFLMMNENITVTLPDAQDFSYVYKGHAITPEPVVMVTQGTQNKVTLTKGKDYETSYKNNINAYTASSGIADQNAPTIIITGKGDYSGTVTRTFTIAKAASPAAETMEVYAADIEEEKTGRTVDLTKAFMGCGEKTGYVITSVTEDNTIAGAVFKTSPVTADIVNGVLTYATNAGEQNDFATIKISVSFVNYEDAELAVKITLAEEAVMHTVTFDYMGHGGSSRSMTVKAGSLVGEPDRAEESGYLFAGWYRDKAFVKGKEWNFAADTVDGDMILYACWLHDPSEGRLKMYIQDIEDLDYTGNAQKPAVIVYDSDGETLLKLNKDYTVKYYNNTNAGGSDASGAVAEALNLGKKDKEEFKGLVPGRGAAGTGGEKPGFDKNAPYIAVIGKGNYTQTVCKNFCIRPAVIGGETGVGDGAPAAGVTLKYTDQLTVNKNKTQNPFSSLKYKKAMKAGTDFTVTIIAESTGSVKDETGKALAADWKAEGIRNTKNQYVLPVIPKGYSGIFLLTIRGTGNYTGEIRRIIHVAEAAKLIKAAQITLGKDQKTKAYQNGLAVTLRAGYYDANTKKNYAVQEDGVISQTPESNANDIFTVKIGKTYLICGQDYAVSYSNNRAVGTATMTITGKGDYAGTKIVTFKITGEKFAANTVNVKAYDKDKPDDPQTDAFRAAMPYTGKAVTQNKVSLSTKAQKPLTYGEHYTISYKNNVKQGTATMTFTARPEAGYSGSFKKTFKIGVADIAEKPVELRAGTGYSLTKQTDAKGSLYYQLDGKVYYSREGAKPSEHISLVLKGEKGEENVLKEGTDYTVSYTNNTIRQADETAKKKQPAMIIKGKGNYKGNVKITFHISDAEMKDNPKLTVTTAATAFNAKQKKEDFVYQPKISVKDGKKALTAKDYGVEYHNNTQKEVKEWLDALQNGTEKAEAYQKRPYAVITAIQGSGYETKTGDAVTIDLNIYQTKLTAQTLYVLVDETGGQTIYDGKQREPAVTVYYGDAKAVKAARTAKETAEATLTKPASQGGSYGLVKLTEKKGTESGDYILTYGANIAAGKNKGSVTVTGEEFYGGSVTVKFDIRQKSVCAEWNTN